MKARMGIQTTLRWTAAIISLILHPFILPVATILVIAPTYATTFRQALLWSTVTALFVSVVPSVFIFALFRSGKISNLNLEAKDQRMKPLLFSQVSVIVGAGVLWRMGAPEAVSWLCVAHAINGLIFLLITLRWKISFHAGVVAGCVTAMALLVGSGWTWLGLTIPIVGWARVYRKRHTVLQTVVAALIATVSTAVILRQFVVGGS